jgi:hypothetical protein
VNLEALRVIHISKAQLAQNDLEFLRLKLSYASSFETCQRWVWVLDADRGELSVPLLLPRNKKIEVFCGQEAYRFLLRWACGLESEVQGETDIFGQIKELWRRMEQISSPSYSDISPWIQRVFEDTKEIRSRYLQNLGGTSYGTLVRKWIKGRAGSATPESILLVGAGQLAQAVAPVLLDTHLHLWNRDPVRASSLASALLDRSSSARVTLIQTKAAEAQTWREASHIVVCVPLDRALDSERFQWFQEGGSQFRSVVHLGARMSDHCIWGELENFANLDDLFILQDSLSQVRSTQIDQALRACSERAQIRALGASLSIPHGWEDLACFV